MKTDLRFGLIQYLNARPFLYGLRELDRDVEIVEAEPSALPELLSAGQVDVALVPSASLFFFPEFKIIGNTCLAAYEEVWSVVLEIDEAVEKIRTVALDPASITSSLLVRVILEERYRIKPKYLRVEGPGDHADARLCIGDRGIRSTAPHLDLASEWFALTGKPFVFAVWAAKRPGAGPILQKAIAKARKHIDWIADREAGRLRIPADRCRQYLKHIMRYELGREELLGLRLFYSYLVELDLAEDGYKFEILDD